MNADDPNRPAPDAPAPAPAPAVVRSPQPWKLALGLTAIFLCGALVGGLVTLNTLRRETHRRMNPNRWAVAIMGRLDAQLALTPEQREAIAPLVRDGAAEARKVRGRAMGDTMEIVRRTHGQIAERLNPDQRRRLDELVARRGRIARRWLGPIRPPPGDPATVPEGARRGPSPPGQF